MLVQENYELPLEEFEWRTTLFHLLKDIAIESIVEIVTNYKEEDHDIEWKDDDAVMSIALEDNVADKLHKLIKEKMENHFDYLTD